MTDDNNSENDNANGNGNDNDTLPPPHIYVHLFFFFLTRSCPPAQRPLDLLNVPMDAIVARSHKHVYFASSAIFIVK